MNDTLLDGELRFAASRPKALFAFVAALILVGAALLHAAERPLAGWAAVALFALVSAAALKLLVSDEFYLRLTREGFEIAGLWRHREFRWSEVEPFVVGAIRGLRFVSVRPSHDDENGLWSRAWRRLVSGATILNLYEAPIDDICSTLNLWRERYTGQGS